MTPDEVTRMAREAGFTTAHEVWPQEFERFAALVSAHERKECAKVVGEFAQKWWSIHCASNKHMETTRKAHDDFCALQSAIRDVLAQPEPAVQGKPGAIHQFRVQGCSDWYDGHPDYSDGTNAYETRTLYTTPQPAPCNCKRPAEEKNHGQKTQ